MQWALFDNGDVSPSSLYKLVRKVCAHNTRTNNNNALLSRVRHHGVKKR